MGFHKRFINRQIIESTKNDHMSNLFDTDALLFNDDWSYDFYKLFLEGENIETIKNKLNKNENFKEE